MKYKVEVVEIGTDLGPCISYHALQKLTDILTTNTQIYLGSPSSDKIKEQISKFLPKRIHDFRGRIVLYIKKEKGYVKLTMEPDKSIEDIAGIKVLKEVKCTDLEDLVQKIKQIGKSDKK